MQAFLTRFVPLFSVARYSCLIAILISLTAIADSAQRPNVLLIVCDDLNTHVSTSGYDQIQTPAFDRLAAEGVTFERAYCQYPVCGPSRASFLHGLYPESTGVLDNKADIRQTRPGTVSMPQYFKQHGYWTASVGKVFHSPRHEHGEVAWHEHERFENDELPIVAVAKRAFEAQRGSIDLPKNRRLWRDARKAAIAPLNAQTPPGHGPSGLSDHQHRDGKNVRQVVDWLKQGRPGDKPFFIALGIQKPHVPFLAPQKYFDLYPAEKIEFFRDRPNLWDSIPRDAINGRYREFGFELGVENESRRREFMQAYHACVSFIDAQISIVLEHLKVAGLDDNTIVVLTSDHGYHLGDHFLWGKVTLFDIGAKVPLVIRVPDSSARGQRCEAMAELVDLFPTLTDLAGLPAPEHLQGVSLAPLLDDPAAEHEKSDAYSVVTWRGQLGYAIRNQNWRYAKWPGGEELYDLRRDPSERHNLAANPKHVDHLERFRATLELRQSQARAHSPTPHD